MSNHIQLRHFWDSHSSDYIPEFKGDVTKSFLLDLIEKSGISSLGRQIIITSVNRKTSKIEKISRVFSHRNHDQQASIKAAYGISDVQPVNGAINIWFTAENIRPPLLDKWDYFLSFEVDDFNKRNSYLPLWMTRLGPTLGEVNQKMEELTRVRNPDSDREKNFAIVASHPELYRMYFVEELKKLADVAIYGRLGETINNKHSTLQQYNFNLCFENDVYPGYVTEKPIEAWLSGCIPVWRGADTIGILNERAILNTTGMNTDMAIEALVNLSCSPQEILEKRMAPILNYKMNVYEIAEKLGTAIYKK